MKRLWLWELKKLFHTKSAILLVIFLCLFPALLSGVFSMDGQRMANETYTNQELATEKDKIRREIAGAVDETWQKNVSTQMQALETQEEYETSLRYQVLSEAYTTGMFLADGREQALNDKKTPSIIKRDAQQHTIRFGPYEGWLTLMKLLEYSGVVFMIGLIYLCSNLFNQEHMTLMMDQLKSCRYGRKQLALVKLGVVLTITLLLGLGMLLALLVGATMSLDLSGAYTTVWVMGLQVFTFQEIFLQAIALFLIGGLACASVSTFASSFCKKSATSLLIGIFFYVLPNLLEIPLFDIAWQLFTPSVFIKFGAINQLMMAPWLGFTESLVFHRATTIGFVWSVLLILLFVGSYHHHCKTRSLFRKGTL